MSNKPDNKIPDNKLKEIRELRNLHQDELAKAVGLTGMFISYLENRNRGFTQETTNKICMALNCTIGQLLGEESLENIIKESLSNSYNNPSKLVVVSENKYPINDEYIEYSTEIIDQNLDDKYFSTKEKSKMLTNIYKIAYDYHENNLDIKDHIAKLEQERSDVDQKILAAKTFSRHIKKNKLNRNLSHFNKSHKKIEKINH